jgi:Flp pilus assembly protein TadG
MRVKPTNRKSNGQNLRRGVLAVEFAMTLPIVFSIFIASLEFSRLNMIRNSTDNAAYEGARAGILPGATAAKVRAQVDRSLKAVGIRRAQVVVQPSVITSSTPSVEVSVIVPLADNAWVSPLYSTSRTITKSCKLSRETSLNTD